MNKLTIYFLAFAATILTSCSPNVYYQVHHVKSKNMKQIIKEKEKSNVENISDALAIIGGKERQKEYNITNQ